MTKREENMNQQEALCQSERYSVTVIEQAALGIFLYDAHSQRILVTNLAYRNLLGYTQEEILGLPVDYIFDFSSSWDDIEAWRLMAEKMPLTSSSRQRHRHKDGSSLDVEVTASLISYGSRESICGFVRPFMQPPLVQQPEDNQQWFEQKSRTRTLDASRETMDEFLAVLAHELRTPLNSTLGAAWLLHNRKPDDVKYICALETIERNVRYQAQLIDNLLDSWRLLKGELAICARQLNLARVLRAAFATMHPLAEAKAIRLQLFLDTKAVFVSADPVRLHQVMLNLLSNAIKFTPNGGLIEIRLERTATQAQIAVKDTGEGIDPDFLPYVFERYRQAKRFRPNNGLGLGLAIVRHLVESHGGTVRAESLGKGQGATFIVTLPLLSDKD